MDGVHRITGRRESRRGQQLPAATPRVTNGVCRSFLAFSRWECSSFWKFLRPAQKFRIQPRLVSMKAQSSRTEAATATDLRDGSGKAESLADKINTYDMDRVASEIDDGEFDAPTYPRPFLSSAQGLISRIGPVLILNFVTVLWGSQHAVIKLAVDSNDGGSPAQLNFLRFAIAALIFLPFAPSLPFTSTLTDDATASDQPLPSTVEITSEEDPSAGAVDCEAAALSTPSQKSNSMEQPGAEKGRGDVWLAGGWLGLWTFAGYAMQSVGLQYTSASSFPAIVLGTCTAGSGPGTGSSSLRTRATCPVLTEYMVIARLLYGREISQRTWTSAAVAVAGTALLGFDGSPPNLGDAWSLGAACASACFILSLEAAAREHKSGELNAVAQLTVALLCGAWVLLVDHPASVWDLLPSSQSEALTAVYLGVVTTALTSFLQTVGQQSVKAEKAAIIFAMDPVYAAGFSYLLLHEQLGAQGLAGAALLVLAAVYCRPMPNKVNSE